MVGEILAGGKRGKVLACEEKGCEKGVSRRNPRKLEKGDAGILP